MTDELQPLIDMVTNALEDVKAVDISLLDVKPMTSIADAMIVATGTSKRHVKSLADEVVEQCKKAGHQPLGVEGEQDAEWILVDLNAVLVHVMTAQTREFYDLERLWSVAPSDDQQESTE